MPADACSLTTHCYAVIRWHPTPSLHGIKEYNLTNCLNGTAPNFANSEEWIGTNDVAWGSASLTWVEEGIKDGGGVNGDPHPYSWFWAEKPPGLSYQEHYPSVTSTRGTEYPTSIQYNGNNTWLIRRSGTTLATAWNNPPSGKWAEAGAEFTENVAVVNGAGDNLAWGDTSDNYTNGWSASGYNNPVRTADNGSSVIWLSQWTHFQYSYDC